MDNKVFFGIFIYEIIITLKDLNIKKKRLIFRIRIKNTSRCNSWLKNSQKGFQIEPKLKRGFGTQESHSALLECRLAQTFNPARGLLDQDKAYLFRIFRDKDMFQFIYDLIQLIFLSIPTSINRGNKLELGALLFWLFYSPYVKHVLRLLL